MRFIGQEKFHALNFAFRTWHTDSNYYFDRVVRTLSQTVHDAFQAKARDIALPMPAQSGTALPLVVRPPNEPTAQRRSDHKSVTALFARYARRDDDARNTD